MEEFDIGSYTSDIELTDEQIHDINDIIGRIKGTRSGKSFVKNENGLIMLSKKCVDEFETFIQHPRMPYYGVYPYLNSYHRFVDYPHRIYYVEELSACIYTGDMNFDVKSCPTILDFLVMITEPLLLFQIPHHASHNNSSDGYYRTLPSAIFFWHDNNYDRFNKNTISTCSMIDCVIIDTMVGLVCEFHEK